MARVNEKTKGVFVNIIGSAKQLNACEVFINQATADKEAAEEVQGKTGSLSLLLDEYKNLISRHKGLMEDLASLETIILQLRSLEQVEIKLSLVREYIYARCPFYRSGKSAKDIRVLVDTTGKWTKNIDELYHNPAFMERAARKLKDVMEKEINKNITKFKNISKAEEPLADHMIRQALTETLTHAETVVEHAID